MLYLWRWVWRLLTLWRDTLSNIIKIHPSVGQTLNLLVRITSISKFPVISNKSYYVMKKISFDASIIVGIFTIFSPFFYILPTFVVHNTSRYSGSVNIWRSGNTDLHISITCKVITKLTVMCMCSCSVLVVGHN